MDVVDVGYAERARSSLARAQRFAAQARTMVDAGRVSQLAARDSVNRAGRRQRDCAMRLAGIRVSQRVLLRKIDERGAA